MVGESHRFGKPLGLIIHAPNTDRIHVSPVAFRLGMDQGVAVNFRGAGQKEFRSAAPRQSQCFVSSQRTDLESLNRIKLVIDGTRRGSKVKDGIKASGVMNIFRDILLDKLETLLTRCSIFSRFPVMRLSMTTTSQSRSMNNSARYDPMKPAPPVIKTLLFGIAASPRSDTKVFKIMFRGQLHIPNVAPIENHRLLEQ